MLTRTANQTPEAALQTFLSQFLKAYSASSVPKDAALPYLTYESVMDAFNDSMGSVSIAVNLWYASKSQALLNAKAREMSQAIGRGGIQLLCDTGVLWIRRGRPFAQAITDDVLREYINLEVEYLTHY